MTVIRKPSPVIIVKAGGETVADANAVFAELRRIDFDLRKAPVDWGLMEAATHKPVDRAMTDDDSRRLVESVRANTSCAACGLMCYNCRGCGGAGLSIGK